MDSHSQETLRRVQENDDTLEILQIGLRGFSSSVGDDYSRLGTFTGKNTRLTMLEIELSDGIALDVTNSAFYDGLKHNSSIHQLNIYCYNVAFVGGVVEAILKAYEENNNLTLLRIFRAGL